MKMVDSKNGYVHLMNPIAQGGEDTFCGFAYDQEEAFGIMEVAFSDSKITCPECIEAMTLLRETLEEAQE
jgi:hypothetical protein